MEGLKYDQDKPDLSLVPAAFIEAAARAFMFGEKKYSRGQYRAGFECHRLIAACMRHLTAWYWTEEAADDSGLSHLDHAAASLAMLIDCRAIGTLGESSRPALKRSKKDEG